MSKPQFVASPKDRKLIEKIAERAIHLPHQRGMDEDFLSAVKDITAVHCNGTPLRLAQLAEAKDFDFAHDVLGIRKNVDRKTGKLANCFPPRFAV